MSDYRQYRADFAKAAQSQLIGLGVRDDTGEYTFMPGAIAIRAVKHADALIAELERTEVQEPEKRQLSKASLQAIFESMPNGVSGFCVDWGWLTFAREVEAAHGITGQPQPTPEPPAPDLPRLGTGWKWAPRDGTHKITHFDIWFENDGRLTKATDIGAACRIDGLATPDWHNPENIESPGEGYRFLVKGEMAQSGDKYHPPFHSEWGDASAGGVLPNLTYRTPATRPLPPVLADEKEAQP